jgi:aldose sugar dehydrogenase
MKKIILIISICTFALKIQAYTLQKYNLDLNFPWGMTWVDSSQLLITEKKNARIILVDTINNTHTAISHQIPVAVWGQGGLLDIISEGNTVWVTCSIIKEKLLTTAVYKSTLSNNSLIDSKLIFEAKPYILNAKHFGSRLTLKDDYLYVSVGERGKGMISQDSSNTVGSIVRIHKDGSIPNDNPFVDKKDWVKELFQIGVRNPQGMDLDPLTNNVYISNHGPKGGDFVGQVLKGTNYGWKRVGWGGTNYSGTKIGEGNAWEPGLLRPDHIWVPSIGVGGIKFYIGDLFPEFKNSLLIGSLKYQYLSYLQRNKNGFGEEQLVFRNKIGRIRDIEVNTRGEIFLIADEKNTTLYKLIP